MNHYLFYFALSCSIGLAVFACKKIEQPEMAQLNKECDCAKEVSADFKIIELEDSPQFNPEGVETDTICRERGVRFVASESDAEYTWYIGSEILTTQTVGRYFNSDLINQNIPIALVVRKKPNLICFPTDDGYDSIVKYMHVSPRPFIVMPDTAYFTPTAGTYRVKGPHLVDSFDVAFWAIPHIVSGGTSYSYKIFNYDGLGSNCLNSIPVYQVRIKAFTYRKVWLNNVGFPQYFGGSIHRRLDGVTEMNFSYSLDGTSAGKVSRNYYGRKIN